MELVYCLGDYCLNEIKPVNDRAYQLEYFRYHSLRNSFPKEIELDIRQAAAIGLYQAKLVGETDANTYNCCICVHCAVRLVEWQRGDIPSVEHKKFSPGCNSSSLNIPQTSHFSNLEEYMVLANWVICYKYEQLSLPPIEDETADGFMYVHNEYFRIAHLAETRMLELVMAGNVLYELLCIINPKLSMFNARRHLEDETVTLPLKLIMNIIENIKIFGFIPDIEDDSILKTLI